MITGTMPSSILQNNLDQELIETVHLGFWAHFARHINKKIHVTKVRSPIFAILNLIASLTDFMLNIHELPNLEQRDSMRTQSSVLETKCAAILAAIVNLDYTKRYELRTSYTSYNPRAVLPEGIAPTKKRFLLWCQIFTNCARCHVPNPRMGELEPTMVCPTGINEILEIGMSKLLGRLVAISGRPLRYLARLHQMDTAYEDYVAERESGIGLNFLPPQYV